MKLHYFLYFLSIGITCIAILIVYHLIIVLPTLAFSDMPNPTAVKIEGGLGIALAITTTAKLRPFLRRISGLRGAMQKKTDKFHAKYPIVGLDVPVKALEHGDRLKIAGRGDYIYSGKFMGKYVIIPTSGEEAIEITPDEMLRNCKEIRGEYGPKWTAPQN